MFRLLDERKATLLGLNAPAGYSVSVIRHSIRKQARIVSSASLSRLSEIDKANCGSAASQDGDDDNRSTH
jgi:hypothetical protein